MRQNRWAAQWVWRVLGNALAGGVWFAVVGAACLGAGGYLVGAIIDFARVTGEGNVYAAQGARLGVSLGMVSGLAGAVIFGVATLKAGPGRFWRPLQELAMRVAWGQIAATLATGSGYLIFAWINAHAQGQRFAIHVSGNVLPLLLGAPLLMIGGAIIGALSKRR